MRGRDHGLDDYNAYRRAYGLRPIRHFNEIGGPEVGRRLQQAYRNVNEIDLWVGVVCERSAPGGILGELGSRIVAETFKNIRDGDRFWYEGTYPKKIVREIKQTTFSDVIKRNTGFTNLAENVFQANGAQISFG